MACEDGVFPVRDDGADGAFDGDAVDLDSAIGQEAAQTVTGSRDIGQGLAQW